MKTSFYKALGLVRARIESKSTALVAYALSTQTLIGWIKAFSNKSLAFLAFAFHFYQWIWWCHKEYQMKKKLIMTNVFLITIQARSSVPSDVALEVISYIGCVLSIIGLVVTILIHLLSRWALFRNSNWWISWLILIDHCGQGLTDKFCMGLRRQISGLFGEDRKKKSSLKSG